MSIILAGVSHKTAPVEVRERLAFTKEACANALRALVDGRVVREALIVSTCNRVEVVAEIDPAHAEEGSARVSGFLADGRSVSLEEFSRHLYTRADREAVRHLFRVASSLDSMVIGEPQILGQVRQAYSLAVETGTTGKVLHRLMHHAFRAAKRVRTETEIASHAVSVSYTAVELGRKIFDSLEGRTVLLIGAGEMAELAARHLLKAGAARLVIANRTHSAAERLAAEFKGEAVAYERLAQSLAEADIVICSTGATRYLVTPEMARAALEARRNRPLFLIDISVPRNIDPAVGQIKNLFVFDVDDMGAVVASNRREREREAERAEQLVECEVMQFEQSLLQLDIGPTIGAMRQNLEAIARAELKRQRHSLGALTPEQERAVESLLMATVHKISHPVIHRMRSSYEAGEVEFVNSWRDIFGPIQEQAPARKNQVG